MDTKERPDIFSAYPPIAKCFLSVVIIFLFLFFVGGQIIFPDERDSLNIDSQKFEADWKQVLDNGETIPVKVPGKVPAEHGEVITFSTTLPDTITDGKYLCFRTVWQDVDIYIDGDLRYHYNTEDSRPFGTGSTTRYLFVKLYNTDAGKELSYHFSSNVKYAGDMRTVYIGDRFGLWCEIMRGSGVKVIVATFLLLLSLFCILVCLTLKYIYKKTISLHYLAWAIFFCSLWMLSESEMRQLVIPNLSVFSSYSYWSLMIVPFPLLLYLDDIQNGRYRKLFFFPIVYAALVFIVCTTLQIFDIAQFTQSLIFVHVSLLLCVVSMIGSILMDAIRKKLSEYLFVGIGFCGMLFTAVVELFLYYQDVNLTMGTVLAVGLMFLLIMAIIKSGQDLFRSEKSKQKAIMAKDAQAKFLASMSHEIRTPINVIIGMNEMILRECDNDTIQGYAQDIQSASNMLLGLINDVLDFSKIESGQLELVEDTYSLSALLQDTILLLNARAAKKPISTQVSIDSQLPSKLYGDELRIKQVLINVLSNAVKYTSQGVVSLNASFKQIDKEQIMLCFSIQDTGIGIKEEDLSKLFDSFKRLELDKNRAIQGTGLGLNIAKQLVDQMHGKITVKSKYGEGSTFTIYIPQKIMDSAPVGNLTASLYKAKKKPVSTSSKFTAENASVLIVDDNSMNLSLMKGLLKRTKIHVDLAAGGIEALELTKSKKYDIIFMDHMMPELDGIETLHLLRADTTNENQNAIVIALTANAIAGIRDMYLEHGFNDYFSKPVQIDKLDDLLLQYLPKELVHLETENNETQNATPNTGDNDNMGLFDNLRNTLNATNKVQNENETLIDELSDINREVGLSYCMNSDEFYNEILLNFCTQAKDYVTKLKNFYDSKDWENYQIIAHGLKSATLSIGATEFSNLSLQHEVACREKDEEFLNNEFTLYIQVLEALIKKIEKML